MKLALCLYGVTLCLVLVFWHFLNKPDDIINDCSMSRFALYQTAWYSTNVDYPNICREKPQRKKTTWLFSSYHGYACKEAHKQ